MNENDQRDPEPSLEAPMKLLAALKEASHRQIFVPPYVDQKIAKAAREHFAKRTKPRFVDFRHWTLWPALSVACVLIAWVARLLTTPTQPHFAREDLNRDGRVDILDSFTLARELKDG